MSPGCDFVAGGGCPHRHSNCGAPGTVPLCQLRRRDAFHLFVSPLSTDPRLHSEKTKPAISLFSLLKRDSGSKPAASPCNGPNARPPIKEKKESFMSIGIGRPGSADGVTRFATTTKLKPIGVVQGIPAPASASPISDSIFRVLGRAIAGEEGPPVVGTGDGFSSTPTSSTEATQVETLATPSSESNSVVFPEVMLSSPAGHTASPSGSKYLLVLGDDPKQKKSSGGNMNARNNKRKQRFLHPRDSLQKKRKPVYNYYASGGGWWDSDMEGIDSEEVGFNEIWEGMGSTTIGGLQWH